MMDADHDQVQRQGAAGDSARPQQSPAQPRLHIIHQWGQHSGHIFNFKRHTIPSLYHDNELASAVTLI